MIVAIIKISNDNDEWVKSGKYATDQLLDGV